ncbi:MAG: chitobiase/beta-hexosaminidase C-terminal domain-containing protein [Prevotella sp.]|nr:chitobiase/beta-hexosaminidase C-terminal domain-containing protein [Prevotella sp.]
MGQNWKVTLLLLLAFHFSLSTSAADGWPSQYKGVMLQGFYWDSFDATKWTNLQKQAGELGQYFDLVWLPQSASCGGLSMGYDDLYWFSNYNSSFGTEAELRSLIKAFSDNGIGTIADVVVNHRKTLTGKNFDFPTETYRGVTYQMGASDVVSGDGGTGKADTGTGWNGMPDLDHTSENVQNTVKAYLKMLLDDFGYVGFRYDMVKGYSGSYTKLYNESANPQFSVGECWDGTQTIRNWIDATGKTSAAFDFQFRYTVRNAANNGQWNRLAQRNDNNWPLVSNNYQNGDYRRLAVTFVENHDTERRPNDEQDPLKKDTLAANAYLLAMPGTPCIFLTHWLACKKELKAMMDVRKFVGIHNESTYENRISNAAISSVAAYETQGTDGSLLVVVGKLSDFEPAETDWVKVLSGYHYAYYLRPSMETPWIDLPSGTYNGSQQAVLTAVSASQGAQLVYTTDGSTPSASNGTRVGSGASVEIPVGTTTLSVGLLVGGAVTKIVTRKYEVTSFEPYEITIYVNTDRVGWSSVNFWSWGGDGTHSPANSSWPGDRVSTKTTIDGRQWFAKTYTINAPDDYVNFVFSTGSGSPQTVDIENISTDTFFEISTTQQGGKYLTDNVTSVEMPTVDVSQPANAAVYDLQGRRQASFPSKKGIYIIKGKKIVIK